MFLQHFEELFKYFQFGLWWVALGVASSIGLGKSYDYSCASDFLIVLALKHEKLFLCGHDILCLELETSCLLNILTKILPCMH